MVRYRLLIIIIILIIIFCIGCTSIDEKGMVLDGIDVPDNILDVSKDSVQHIFNVAVENYPDYGYINWRIVNLDYNYTYEDLWDKDFVVYQVVYEFLSETPENVVLVDRMYITEDNWVMPSHTNGDYLIFEKNNDTLSLIGTVLASEEAAPGRHTFTEFIRQSLNASSEFGKEKESIKKIISTQEGIVGKIDIFDMLEVEEYRIIGFYEGDSVTDGNIGYALFKSNKKGEYEFDYLNVLGVASLGDRTFTDIVTISNYDKKSETIYNIIITNNPFIGSVERTFDNEYKETLYITHTPSINIMKIHEIKFNSATFNYYDSFGEDITGKSIEEIIINYKL